LLVFVENLIFCFHCYFVWVYVLFDRFIFSYKINLVTKTVIFLLNLQ
jgi:hypothetical protein